MEQRLRYILKRYYAELDDNEIIMGVRTIKYYLVVIHLVKIIRRDLEK